MYKTNYYGEDGMLLAFNYCNLNAAINALRDGDEDKYGFFRGVKLTSKMSDEEIYSLLYGSKEEYYKKYPHGDENDCDTVPKLKQEQVERLYKVGNDFFRNQMDKLREEKKEINVDRIGSELILALSAGASFEEVSCLLDYYGQSGTAYDFYRNYVVNFSNQGMEFGKYLDGVSNKQTL